MIAREMKIAVVGKGGWGTANALLLEFNGDSPRQVPEKQGFLKESAFVRRF